MGRVHLFEIHDLEACPVLLRSTIQGLLRLAIGFTHAYDRTIPLLERLLRAGNTREVVDLCSGSGGPWPSLHPLLERALGEEVRVLLTDKFPDPGALDATARAAGERVGFRADSVDATATPAALEGARTLFTSFHHFRPDTARRILRDAAERRVPIGIFEGNARRLLPCIAFLFIPLVVLLMTPFLRPWSWSRAFWTYVVPVFPLAMLWDGMVSNLRAYSPRELDVLASGIEVDGYVWETGRLESGWPRPPITYLLGYRAARSH